MADQSDVLQRAIDEVIAPLAELVDRSGSFPRAGIDALAQAGILGLISATDVGGGGQDMRTAAQVVERISGACGSTAMILLMHYAATAVIEAHGPKEVREAIAAGRHLSTLAFSEVESRSQFWVSHATALSENGKVRLDARKSWVTSAGEAASYVLSTRPLAADGPMTLWLVPSDWVGLRQPDSFDGLGLRGNASTPITADAVIIPPDLRLGDDGAGLDIVLTMALPWFLVLSAAFSLGLMEAVVAKSGRHLTETRLEHLGQRLIDQPLIRTDYARMRLVTDSTRALLEDTLRALEKERPDAMLRVLEVKAGSAEAAVDVTDRAMKVCGGSAFRKELGIERCFRDARAARVMAPTTDALLDFVGRAVAGLPLLES